MDAITIGFFLVASFLVMALMLFMIKSFGNETDFEEAYSRNALRLLTEEKSSKSKSSKASKRNKTGADRKREVVSEKELVRQEKKCEELFAQEAPHAEDAKPAVSEGKQRKKGKKHAAEELNKSQEQLELAQSEKEAEVEEVFEKKGLSSDQIEEGPFEPVTAKVTEKKAKKKRAQKLEEVEPHVSPVHVEGKILESEELLQTTHEKIGQIKVQKSKEPVVPQEMNEETFLSRISEIEGLEPEYLTFVVKHFTDNHNQKKKLTDELGVLKKQCVDREKLVAQCTEKLGVMAKKEVECEKLRRLVDEERKRYEEEKSNYSMYEQTVRNQLAQSVQDKKQLQQAIDQHLAEIGTLKQELMKANAAVHAAPSLDVVKQAEKLRNEVNAFKNTVQQCKSELKQKNQLLEKLMGETQEQKRKIDLLTKSNGLAAQRAQEMEAQAENVQRSFEEKLQQADKTANELQMFLKENTAKMDEERRRAAEMEKQISVMREKMKGNEMERQKLLSENMHYQSQVASLEENHRSVLEKMAQDMKELKKQNDEDKTIIALKLSEASERIAVLNEINADLESNNLLLKEEIAAAREHENSLVLQLKEESQKLDGALKAAETAKESTVRDLEDKVTKLETGMRQNGEPQMKLVSVNEVQNANPTNSNDQELIELRERLSRQEKKNEELRSSNYQLVELSQKQEQDLLRRLKENEEKHKKSVAKCLEETVKLLHEILPHSHFPSTPVSYEIDFLLRWFKKAKDSIKTGSEAMNHFAKDGSLLSPVKNLNEKKMKKLEEKVERYRTALASVSTNIEVIEREANAKKKSYEKEIALLKFQLSTLKNEFKEMANTEKKAKRGNETTEFHFGVGAVNFPEGNARATVSIAKPAAEELALSSVLSSEEEWVVL